MKVILYILFFDKSTSFCSSSTISKSFDEVIQSLPRGGGYNSISTLTLRHSQTNKIVLNCVDLVNEVILNSAYWSNFRIVDVKSNVALM